MSDDTDFARRWRGFSLHYLVVLLSAAVIIAYLDRGVIAVLVPHLKAQFGLDDVRISILQGITFSFFFAVATLGCGPLVDRWNRRNIIIAGILVWSVMTIYCGLASNFWQLAIGRAGVGIGEACLLPAAYSMIASSFAPSTRGRAMSIIAAATSVGGGSAAVVGGALLTLWQGLDMVRLPLVGEIAPWRAVFIVAGAPGFIIAILLLMVKEPGREAPASERKDSGSLTAFFRSHWILITAFYLAFSLILFFSYAVALWSPAVLIRSFGLSPGYAGLLSGSLQLSGSVSGCIVSGFATDVMIKRNLRFGRLRIYIVGMIPALIGSVLLGMPVLQLYLLGLGLAIFASGLLATTSYPTLYDVIPAEMRGRSLAVYLFLANIIGLGGGAMAVAFITRSAFQDEAMLQYSVVVAALGSLLASLILIMSVRERYDAARHMSLDLGEETASSAA